MNDGKKSNPKSNDSMLSEQSAGKRANIIRKISSFLIELVVPVIGGIIVWYIIAYSFKLWRMSDLINTVLFVVILISVSFLVNRIAHYFRGSGKGRGIFVGIISAIVIPLIISALANTVPVSGNSTVLTVALTQLMGVEEYPFIKDIGNTIILSTDSKIKAEGIDTLRIIHTELTLQELFRVLDQDKTILYDFTLYDDLSTSIASYDLLPRDRLVKLFHNSTSASQGTPRGLSFDLYSYYYEKSFEGLRTLLTKETTDSSSLKLKLLKLDEAEAQLKQTLNQLESSRDHFANPTLNFVLETFLKMDKLQSDNEIYGLAKTIAADTTYAEATRYSAILLVAKLGTKDDFGFLVPYLNDNSESIKAGALRAISILHLKLYPSQPEKK